MYHDYNDELNSSRNSAGRMYPSKNFLDNRTSNNINWLINNMFLLVEMAVGTMRRANGSDDLKKLLEDD